ncbi:MAG: hypothetical protein OHK005_09010 [Candidatus Methylacidiphilales bacterium]
MFAVTHSTHPRHQAERLLAALVARARARPGLFPVRDADGFLAMIGFRLGWSPGATLDEATELEELSAFCELAQQLDARPEDSHHWYALSQLQRGFPPLSPPVGASEPEPSRQFGPDSTRPPAPTNGTAPIF